MLRLVTRETAAVIDPHLQLTPGRIRRKALDRHLDPIYDRTGGDGEAEVGKALVIVIVRGGGIVIVARQSIDRAGPLVRGDNGRRGTKPGIGRSAEDAAWLIGVPIGDEYQNFLQIWRRARSRELSLPHVYRVH